MSSVCLSRCWQEWPPASARAATYWIAHSQDKFPAQAARCVPQHQRIFSHKRQAVLNLTGKLKICSWQAHPEPYRIYFEVNNTACLEGPDSQAGIYVLPPGTKYRIITSSVCICCTDTFVEKCVKPWHLFLKEKFSEKKNVSQQARLQCSVLPQRIQNTHWSSARHL